MRYSTIAIAVLLLAGQAQATSALPAGGNIVIRASATEPVIITSSFVTSFNTTQVVVTPDHNAHRQRNERRLR